MLQLHIGMILERYDGHEDIMWVVMFGSSAHMMRQVCVHDEDEVASCVFHSMNVGSACEVKTKLFSKV